MTGPRSFPLAWIEAARFERDRRAQSYPRLVADRKIDAETATVDYQAWCAIAEWLETGVCRLIGSWGGVADPPVAVITWRLLEQSAAKALASIEAKMGRLERDGSTRDDPALVTLGDRRFAVDGIVAIVAAQRESIARTDALANRIRAEMRAEREGVAA